MAIPPNGGGAASAAPAELAPEVLKQKLKALPPDALKALLEDLGKK
jgi:hypothetical protein